MANSNSDKTPFSVVSQVVGPTAIFFVMLGDRDRPESPPGYPANPTRYH
jgi:hypothetical protein